MPERPALECGLQEPEGRASASMIVSALETAFARIERERMRGIPILNPALKVAATGIRQHGGVWFCALVTPWFINVMAVPQTEAGALAWSGAAPGAKVMRQLPAGVFEFMHGSEEGLGPYQMCSLFSPVLEFENQEAAVAAAEAAMNALFGASLHSGIDGAAQPAEAAAQAKREVPKMSRRVFLLGSPRPAGA